MIQSSIIMRVNINKILFLTGLLVFLLGQLILSRGNEYVYKQEPIDFAHWLLLIGAVLLIPQTLQFPKKFFNLAGILLTLTGIICIVGMCVLDFIFWSFPNDQMRNDFFLHISRVPSIWLPFMSIGPSSKVFNVGLLILSLNYFEKGKIGILLLLTANLILWHIIPVPFRLVFGYLLTLIGFSFLFLLKNDKT